MSRLILVNRYFHPDESATSQFATDLARHLARRREVVVLASRQLLEQPGARLARQAELDGVRVRRLWSTSRGRQGLAGRLLDYVSFLAAVSLWLLLRARKGDVVLAKTDPPLLGVATTLATLGRGVRRVQWLQDLFPETAERLAVLRAGGPVARMARALRDWSLRRSDLVVTVSEGMLDHLRGRAGAAHLAHIPNWSDDHLGQPGDGASPAAGGPAAGVLVGYSGNLGRAHPIDGLLQLARDATDPALRFQFSGGGAHYERLRAHVRQLGRDNWAFLPYQSRERLGALLRQPDLHLVILDPRAERFVFPSKVYGALSAGRPVLHLGDPEGEVARLLREHGCGWTVRADDAGKLLAQLRELRADPARLRQAGRAARTCYESRYSPARALSAWDDALEQV